MKKIKEVILVFENCDTCKLDTTMFRYLIIQEIYTNLSINCYQYLDGTYQKIKSCNYFSIKINKKGLKQKCNLEKTKTLKEKILVNDLVSINLICNNNKTQEIYVPWNDESDYINEFQENICDNSENITINIKKI